MELRFSLWLALVLQLFVMAASQPLHHYQRLLRREDEFFKPFNLLGQAQAPLDDYDSTISETWIEDNPPPESSFRLIEAPVQLSNPVYNFFTKANAFLRWIRNN